MVCRGRVHDYVSALAVNEFAIAVRSPTAKVRRIDPRKDVNLKNAP